MKQALAFTGILALALTFCSFTSPVLLNSDAGPWVRLGTKKVNFGLDRDVMRVGAAEGGFRKLKVKVSGGGLNMHKMVVEYGNGTKDNIRLKHNFRRGSDTRIIDLQAGKRVIKDITFWYDSDNRSRRRATVQVFGRK